MSQLQEAMATAIAAVLANASGAAHAISRALQPLTPTGEGGAAPAAAAARSSKHAPHPPDPAAGGTVRLAVAAVLYNAQHHAPALQAACAGAIAAARARLQLAPRPAAVPTAKLPASSQQHMAGLGRRAAQEASVAAAEDPASCRRASRAREVRFPVSQVLVQHVRGIPPAGDLGVREAMRKLGLPGEKPDPRVSIKLYKLRNFIAHGQDPFRPKRPHSGYLGYWVPGAGRVTGICRHCLRLSALYTAEGERGRRPGCT
ncbi:hypothetical protein TSOC_014203, partial [Tetrabaena socialis]